MRVCLESEILEFLQFDELEFRRRPPSVTLDHSLTVRLHTPRVNTSSEYMYSLSQNHKISSQDFLILRNFVKDWLKSFVHETGQ